MGEESLAQRLRKAREYKGWSQTELAKRSKINNVQISKLERGITRDITGATLRALCKALGVSPSYILGMSDDLDSELLTTVGV
jgi:transcriptional regulator with XRE-family HTH domain